MATKYTPGPWEIDELFGAIDGEEFISIQHEGMPICQVRGTNDMSCLEDDEMDGANEMVLANAQLIAAAPDLLEALEELQEKWSPASHYWGSPTNEKVDLALKKAKGL